MARKGNPRRVLQMIGKYFLPKVHYQLNTATLFTAWTVNEILFRFMMILITKIQEFSLENCLTPLLITLSINPPPFIKVEKNICKNAETLNQEDWIHCSKDVNMIGKYISS